MGANVRDLNWEEIDPVALHGAGEVLTQVRFWQRSWFIGFLFMLSIVCLVSSFVVQTRIVQTSEASVRVSAFVKEVTALESLDQPTQLSMILKERVGFQDNEPWVRKANFGVSKKIGDAWTQVRRSALVPEVDSSQLRSAKQEADRGFHQLEAQKGHLKKLSVAINLACGFLLITTLAFTIRGFQKRATTLVVQSLGANPSGTRGIYSDISASSIRESEAITRAINNLPVAIFEFESDGKILRWNQQMYHLTGIPPEKAIGKSVIDCVQWDSTSEVARSAIRKVFGGETLNGLEWSMIHSLGEKIDLTSTIKPVIDGGGAVRSAAVIVRDITSEKYGRELMISNDVARLAIIKAVPDTLLRFDSSLNLVEVHDNSRIFGSEQTKLRGTSWRDFFGADLVELFTKASTQARLSQRPYNFEFEGQICGKDVAVSFRVAVAGPADILAVISDLSDRKRSLEAEARSERRFKNLIEGSADTVMMLSKEGIVLYCSPAVNQLIGLPENVVVGRNWLELIYKDDRHVAEVSWKHILEQEEIPTNFQVRILGEGSPCPVEVRSRNQLNDRSTEAVIFNLRDVTERRKLEQELNQKLYELNQQNENLKHASMHDPLTGALNYQAVQQFLEAICEYANEGSFSVVLFDIDDFKSFNAHEGSKAGDELLTNLTHHVSSLIRADDIFGRIGSEEFLLILPEVPYEDAREISNRVRAEFERTSGHSVTISTAINHYAMCSITPLALIENLSRTLSEFQQVGKEHDQESAA